MYGKRKYGRLHKDKAEVVEPVAPVSLPTFICSKCKSIKLQASGYTDIFLTLEIHPKKPYRICTTCSVLLETWLK